MYERKEKYKSSKSENVHAHSEQRSASDCVGQLAKLSKHVLEKHWMLTILAISSVKAC